MQSATQLILKTTMSKRTVFTTITPIPAGLIRDTVMTLRNHLEMIDVNPLVVEHYRASLRSLFNWGSVSRKTGYGSVRIIDMKYNIVITALIRKR